MLQINEGIGRIYLQFSFTNPRLVPSQMKPLPLETQENREWRKAGLTGRQVIAPTANCEVDDLLDQLKDAGYELVDACWQQRLGVSPTGRDHYYMIHFEFRKRDQAGQYEATDDLYRAFAAWYLKKLVHNAYWRVRAYVNPPLDSRLGAEDVSINFEVRTPCREADGRLMRQWNRDADGERVGDAPVEVRPNFRLAAVTDGATTVMDVEVA